MTTSSPTKKKMFLDILPPLQKNISRLTRTGCKTKGRFSVYFNSVHEISDPLLAMACFEIKKRLHFSINLIISTSNV